MNPITSLRLWLIRTIAGDGIAVMINVAITPTKIETIGPVVMHNVYHDSAQPIVCRHRGAFTSTRHA